ncbi:radial spoke head 1 protein [Planoprotostelium fungivorum]|uniref:Radial spoke head 1 protein n=1 Tax=Planoprotostelium fungivorum TaxID=1890364 RepID=A0A2P6MQ68_9EUKA|nr:radial spoke head 1 protein [Planoprotostelium fungivorum]
MENVTLTTVTIWPRIIQKRFSRKSIQRHNSVRSRPTQHLGISTLEWISSTEVKRVRDLGTQVAVYAVMRQDGLVELWLCHKVEVTHPKAYPLKEAAISGFQFYDPFSADFKWLQVLDQTIGIGPTRALSVVTIEVYDNGISYIGTFDTQGRRHGKGKLQYQNGDYYEGSFHLGKRHGRGTHVCNGGKHRYEGEFT